MTKPIYIRATAAISPWQALEKTSLDQQVEARMGNKALSIEPNYKDYIPPIKSRRMSRILKMTWVAAEVALKRAQMDSPEMISLATGMGCQADTIKFLEELIENKEEFLKPTAFINSTHNTLAGFLAIGLKSKGQNFTFTHNDLNFEHALLDIILRMSDNEVQNSLLGAVDEIVPETHTIKEKIGMLRDNTQSHLSLFDDQKKGIIEGEGATFFVVDKDRSTQTIASISALQFAYGMGSSKMFNIRFEEFLHDNKLNISQIDYLIIGQSGDMEKDGVLNGFIQQHKLENKCLPYKHITGEYMSSGAMGLWLGCQLIVEQKIPTYINPKAKLTNELKRIVLINHNTMSNYSFILLEK